MTAWIASVRSRIDGKWYSPVELIRGIWLKQNINVGVCVVNVPGERSEVQSETISTEGLAYCANPFNAWVVVGALRFWTRRMFCGG